MATEQKFTRFNKGKSTTSGMMDDSPMSLKEIPDGGLCLSASLVISENFSMTKVLMERIDPSAVGITLAHWIPKGSKYTARDGC